MPYFTPIANSYVSFTHSFLYLLKHWKKQEHESSKWEQDSKISFFLYTLALTAARKDLNGNNCRRLLQRNVIRQRLIFIKAYHTCENNADMWILSNEVSKDNRVLKSTTEAGSLFQACCITHTVWKLKPWFCSLKGVVAYAIRKLISRDDFDRPVRESERARCPSWHWLLRTGWALAAQPVRSQPSSLREADTQSSIAMPPTPQSPSRCIRRHHRRRRLRRWRRLLYLGGKNMQDGPKKTTRKFISAFDVRNFFPPMF